MGAEGIGKALYFPFIQFCCEPKIALNNKVYSFLKDVLKNEGELSWLERRPKGHQSNSRSGADGRQPISPSLSFSFSLFLFVKNQ